MARIVKEKEYAIRRNEILDAAIRLVYRKGFEQMTVQDILNELHISKGAFYHYFESKGMVMEALVERIVQEEVLPLVSHIVQSPGLSALEKLESYFDTVLRWKTGNKVVMISLLRVWMSDENAVLRQKLFGMTSQEVVPMLAEIIRQGVREGTFTTSYPEQVCQVIFYIMQGLSESILELFLLDETDLDQAQVESRIRAFTNVLNDAIERVLGAPAGSLHLVEVDTLMKWWSQSEPTLNGETAISAEGGGDLALVGIEKYG